MKYYDDSEYQLLEPAIYTFEITDAAHGTSKLGVPVMHATFTVCGGKFAGQEIKKSLPAWILCILCSRLGMEKKPGAGDEKPYYDVEPGDLINKRLTATVTHRDWNGKQYNELGHDFQLSTEPVAPTGDEIPF